MVGVIVITHGDFGERLLNAAFGITGKQEQCWALSLLPGEGREHLREKIDTIIGQGGEFIILVDMFGGTPSNVCLPYLKKEKIEVVTGLNLPLLISVLNHRGNKPLADMGEEAARTAQESIMNLRKKFGGRL